MAKTSGGVKYRDYTPNPLDGYRYRQFDDGTIVILASPTATGVGTQLTSGPAWQAITAQIKAHRAGNAVTAINTAAAIANALVASAVNTRPTRQAPRYAPSASMPAYYDQPSTGSPPWGWFAAGGLLLVGALVVSSRGS